MIFKALFPGCQHGVGERVSLRGAVLALMREVKGVQDASLLHTVVCHLTTKINYDTKRDYWEWLQYYHLYSLQRRSER